LHAAGTIAPTDEETVMQRREFLTVAAAGGATLAAGLPAAPAAEGVEGLPLGPPPEVVRGGMRYRKLGRTGAEISAVGLGGFHIGIQKDENESIRVIHAAIDGGITFLDNCWDYNNGASEERMGKALQGGYRDKVFVMTKIDGRTKKEAAKQIDESLRRLKTDHLDLLQHHEIIRLEDPDRIFAPGGAQEAAVAAQKAGKVRFIGFTGHKDPLVHLRMLEVAAKHNFRFDAVQMPLNVMDAHFRSFAHLVLPLLVREGIGVLGMKPLASGLILRSNTATPGECLTYALSLPTSVVITGCDRMEILKQALEVARNFKPLGRDEVAALLSKTAVAAATGKFELFKTDTRFDGTAHHPEWLG
jgi:aryl-alcohol dehydrogenase-like predicted oxidoreductase